MNWFETSTLTSFAKSAIKGAQKTIDKALDIKEENEKTLPITRETPSGSVNKTLKDESEKFFETFGVLDKDEKDLSLSLIKDSSYDRNTEAKNDFETTSRVVGSIWGSFTGSFFENTLANAKELVSSKTISAPVSPSDPVVATQPPRSTSGLPESYITKPVSETSSNSSSIIQLSGEAISPLSTDFAQSPFLEDIKENLTPCASENAVPASDIENAAMKRSGWEWGWESSIMLVPSDEQGEDFNVPKIDTSPLEEESLADDITEHDGFAHSRLIVSSVDSESGSLRLESHSSVNSCKSQFETDLLYSVSEEVFAEPSTSRLDAAVASTASCGSWTQRTEESGHTSVCSNNSSSITPLSVTHSSYTIDSLDSIVILDSCPTSPLSNDLALANKDGEDATLPQFRDSRFSSCSVPATSPEIMRITEGSSNPLSPSSNSIEILSPTSTDSSPTNQHSCSPTVTEDIPSIQSEIFLHPAKDTGIVGRAQASELELSDHGRDWTVTLDDYELLTITKQPLPSSLPLQIRADNPVEEITEELLECSMTEAQIYTPPFISAFSEEGSTSESIHSASTSSTHTVLDANICSSQEIQSLSISEISERCEETAMKARFIDENSEHSVTDIHGLSTQKSSVSDSDCVFQETESIACPEVESRVMSMNAGDIRKKLDNVGKEVEKPLNVCKASDTAVSQKSSAVEVSNKVKNDLTSPRIPISSVAFSSRSINESSSSAVALSDSISEISNSKEHRTDSSISHRQLSTENISCFSEVFSQSESSTETVSTSVDSQQMTWSELVSCDSNPEDISRDMASDKWVDQHNERERNEETLRNNLSKEGRPERKSFSEEVTAEAQDASSILERELSPSSSDSRSDGHKVSSSGHSSADEIETATSSDIEVISSPSIDGSNGNSTRSFPGTTGMTSKVWLSAQRGFRSFLNDKVELASMSSGSSHKKDNGNGTQEKAETGPSSMTTSFTSVSESDGDFTHLPQSEMLQLEASRITQLLLHDINLYKKGHRRNESAYSETSESSSEPQTPETEKLWKKITQLTDILEARETKVLELSHANATMQESNHALKSRIEELERLKTGSDATESVREEFTQRLVTMERKFQQALREKESAKKQLEEYRTEAATRRSHADVARELEEKDTTITELRLEGEKLSKQQLSYSNIIKKLRAKEKDSETCIKDQKEKIESQSSELERLRKQLHAKEEVERRQIDAIRQLTVTNQRQEVDVKDLRSENAELEGKLAALKEALDSAYREMAEFQRAAATRDAEAQEHALSAEVMARQKVEMALADANKQNKREQEMLLAQIHELQDTLSHTEHQTNRMERQLKSEISDLQLKLNEAENRASELSNSVSAATRPLLRQLENLQNSHAAQQTTWESLEESLNKRLLEAQNMVSLCTKKEREAKEQYSSVLSTMSSLQSQVSSLQAENTEVKSRLEMITIKASKLEEEKSHEAIQMEALKRSFSEEIAEVKRERDILEQQLEIEKLAVSAEKKKALSLQEQLKEKDKKITQMQISSTTAAVAESRQSTPGSSPTPSLSRLSISGSVNESFTGSHWVDDVFDPAWASTRSGSVYDTLRGNNAATVEVLTSSIRQREGELHHMQTELTRYEAQKESLAQELVQASRKIDEMATRVINYEEIQEKFKDMEQKYNALLQMYGEKVEEVEELRLDLVDVKEMYKLQIDQLMQK